jgi:hypothetical protein
MLDNEPLAEAPNPFAGSIAMEPSPFPEGAAPVEADYEAAEEVSLEQLLAEGRTRPTFSGSVAVPLDDIEELGAAELVDAPGSVAVMEQPAASGNRVAELEAQVASLEQKLQARQNALESILRELDDLRQRLSGIISS